MIRNYDGATEVFTVLYSIVGVVFCKGLFREVVIIVVKCIFFMI